jgi:hypothetical protein
MASPTTSAIRAARAPTTCPNRRSGRPLQRVFYRSNKTDIERNGKVIEDEAIVPLAQKVGPLSKNSVDSRNV